MAIIKLHVRGKEVSDRLTVKLLIGGICIFILLIVMGGPVMWNWILNSFIIWMGSMFFFIPFAYGFIYENFKLKYIIVMITGLIIIVLYCIYGHQPADRIVISIMQSLVWMCIFSIVLDFLKKRIDF